MVSSGTKIYTFSQGVIHLSAQFMASKTSCNVTIGANDFGTDELRKSSFTINLKCKYVCIIDLLVRLILCSIIK